MTPERYVLVQAVQTKDNELIPVWDKRVEFSKDEMYGNVVKISGNYGGSRVVECILDIKTKKLSPGIELDFYPDEKELEFKVDEVVMYEVSHRKLKQSKIVDIVYEEYELTILKGSKVDKWWMKYFKDVEFISNKLYAIKQWKPYFILENGTKVMWTHQLYKVV